MQSNYDEFLLTKRKSVESVGFEVDDINPMLFDWQAKIVRWALRRGRAAIFEDCGLGKTPQQLEWARHVCDHTGGNVLILTPLAVAGQTIREADKFGVTAHHTRNGMDGHSGVIVTNYERLHYYNPEDFQGIVLDESSILKSFDGKTRKALSAFASTIHYRLACTATPAPNDLIELTNHSEFLDIMRGKEIVALYFIQDGNTTHKWRLKGHAVNDFWKWMASWSVAIRKPSDIGYPDDEFALPPLNVENISVDGDILEGELFQVEAHGLLDRRRARSKSMDERVSKAADIANSIDGPVLIWCDLNKESEALTKAITGAVEVRGSHSAEYKEENLNGFSDGSVHKLVSKPSIAGWGMNWQHCNNMVFVGLSDSYEQYYQAMRRCWRYGQKNPVNIYIITAKTEGAVLANIQRKQAQSDQMFEGIIQHMKDYINLDVKSEKTTMDYAKDSASGENWELMLGDSCERIKEIDDDSIGMSVFSPPFPGMYAYTNSDRDIGNVASTGQLIEHFSFMMADILRITMPGRSCCIHLTQEPTFKGADGYVGLRDFRGDVIRHMESHGWRYYSEVTIDKNPMLKASRTKESTLLFKTLSKDSASCRPALADYILVFKKPGDNPLPIESGTHPRWNPGKGWISADEWCEWASPVWYRAMPRVKGEFSSAPDQDNYPSNHQSTDGISETDVLRNFVKGREDDDEKHLCPLQLGVIERCVKLWSAPGDTVFSPFAGIGSEGYKAIRLHRKFVGIELKKSYYDVAISNLRDAERKSKEHDMPLFEEAVES